MDISTNLIIFYARLKIEQFVAPIDRLLNDKFIPTPFDSDTPLYHIVHDLVPLKPCDGGLRINILAIDSKQTNILFLPSWQNLGVLSRNYIVFFKNYSSWQNEGF